MMLSHDALVAELSKASPTEAWQVHVFDQLPSTNDFLRHQPIDGAGQKRYLCATDWQTDGHGRRGKGWQSQRGNITFTMRQRLQQPAVNLLGLSLVAGIGVVSVLRTRLGLDVNLKWPNDVLIGEGQKLGGLLIELLPVKGTPSTTDVLTGIGLNVRHQPEFDDLGIGATSFERQGLSVELDRAEVIAAVGESVASLYVEFEAQGWPVFESRWEAVDALRGRPVNVTGQQAFSGKACGVDNQGALRVQTDSGMETVMAGDVSVRPV